ncbi:MAG: ABC transporter permease [Capsulimonadaceae bacterium]
MNLIENLRIALRGLASNKMRTGLTMLGIIIGVGVVIIVVAIGQGATESVTNAINSLGTNLLSIRPAAPRLRLTAAVRSTSANTTAAGTISTSFGGGAGSSNQLTLADANKIGTNFPQTIAATAPQVRGGVQVRLGATNYSTSYIGATPDYLYVNAASVDKGRFFSQFEVDGTREVCDVGATVAANLTGDPQADLTGQSISISGQNFQVIGMLTPKGSGAYGQDQDDVVLIPITTAMMRIANKPTIDFLSVRCTSQKMMPLAQEQIAAFLRNRHHLRPPYPEDDDFQITSQTELAARQESVTTTMTSLLSAVAVISLVVGGIGIMNIMLVSVTERTREIGIRKAIGATPRDILLQFLIESAIISLLGGLIGIVIGVAGAIIMSKFGGWNSIVSLSSVLVALLVSASVGLFFGIYPASKAAALHPIEALRYE